MKLYVVRHGQSEDNIARRHSGWAECSLTEQGRADAERAGTILRGIAFDKVFSSDTKRAKQTCAIALPEMQDAVEYTPLIRETNVGTLTGLEVAECQRRWGEEYNSRRKARNFCPYGGENLAMHMERVREFLTMTERGGWDTVAVFSHGGSIHCMLDIVMGEVQNKADYPCGNGSVSVFEYADGAWSLAEWGRME
jgi:broad specificity phosphatase PhoE